MPDDLEGLPFPDGEGPGSDDRSAAADEEFAALVLDEAFVGAARVHEPSADERMLYAAMERAETEPGETGFHGDPDPDPGAPAGFAGFTGGIPGHGYTRWPPDDHADADEDGPEGFDPLEELVDGVEFGFSRFGAAEPVAREFGAVEFGPGDDESGNGEFEDEEDGEGRFDRSDYLQYLPDDADADADDPDHADGPDGTAAPSVSHHRPPPGTAIPAPAPRGLPPAPGGRPRWERPVACVLAMVMGIGVLALALMAVQRAGSTPRDASDSVSPAPPAGEQHDVPPESDDSPGAGD
ncbi:hypothetical protein [Streptomyces sp. RFCAC02]|uniref:SCO2584 family spore wall biosynthesis protein n=1 Tax=Streptomyces sp. RFCAC02 TaxID=2499143 RepID=UPI00102261CE|nr:hypothetical protein [Streptomyces sp. RFCAC02]